MQCQNLFTQVQWIACVALQRALSYAGVEQATACRGGGGGKYPNE